MNTARSANTSIPYRPAPTPPGVISPSMHQEQRHQPADRHEAVVHRVDRAGAGPGRDRGPQAAAGAPKRTSLPSMLPSAWSSAGREQWVAAALGDDRGTGARPTRMPAMAAEERPALAPVADHLAERRGRARTGSTQDQEHLEQVGERRRVLERVRRVGVDEAAAVGAQLLDHLLGGDRARGRWSACAPSRSSRRRSRRRSAGRPARPGRARRRSAIGSSTYSVQRGRRPPRSCRSCRRAGGRCPRTSATAIAMPDRGRDEVLDGEADRLGEVAHRRLARVVLPVGVGGEADGGVEGQVLGHGGGAGRVEGQDRLEPLDQVQPRDRHEAEHEQRDGVARASPARAPGQRPATR